MDSSRWKQVEELFHAALECDAERRAERLSQVDTGLRSEVCALLEAYDASQASGSPDSPAPGSRPSPGPRRIGPYTLIAPLGEGGMGTVYLAERADAQFEKQVAIKLIRAGPGSPLLIRRFHTERQILAGLEHPHIARLLDGGLTDDGQPYLVMEYVDGVRLDKYCDERRLGVRDRLQLLARVCRAVHYAHQSLVVHRDLKPNNILVTPEGEPRLLDFGVAKVTQDGHHDIEQTATVGLFFTPLYASPEILRGQHTTTSTDVYSLGVILYQTLTGLLPHEEHSLSPGDLMSAILTTDPSLPSESVPQATPGEATPQERAALRGETPEKLARLLRGDLDAIALRALGKTPGERYGSAEQMAADLERYLAGQPVLARRQTLAYRGQKFARRNWKGLLAVAAALILVGTVSVYAIRQQLRATQRFEETRAIAKYLLFDLFDQVSHLPGSTAARARMAERAQTELDRLAALAQDNREVQLETANGYHRLAQIYGVPGGPNLGNSVAAAANLQRAQAILARLRQPATEPAIAVAWANNLLLRATVEMWVNGKTPAAEPLIREAAAILAQPDKGRPWQQARYRLRNAQVDLADFQTNWRQEWDVARTGLQELATWPSQWQTGEEYPAARARLLRAAGTARYYLDDIPGALTLYQEAGALLQTASARLPNRPHLLAGWMQSDYDLGTTLDKLGRKQESLEALSRSVETGRQLLQIEDRDQELRRLYFIQRQAYAEVLLETGRPAEAIREQEAVVEERRAQAAARPGVTLGARDLAFALLVLGKTAWGTDRSRACLALRDSLARYEQLKRQSAVTAWDWELNAGTARQLAGQCPAP